MRTQLSLSSVGAIVSGTHENPPDVLGPHEMEHDGRKITTIRAFLPDTQQVWVLHPAHQAVVPMRRIHPAGFYETVCPWEMDEQQRTYQFRVADKNGDMKTIEDPYAFPSAFTGYDRFLIGEGKHYRVYDKLGAHLRTVGDVHGVNFAVWAPNASGVSVVGDFNQ